MFWYQAPSTFPCAVFCAASTGNTEKRRSCFPVWRTGSLPCAGERELVPFIQTGITKADSEGINRVIKTVARDAYGFRNPDNQRLRTRYATTRRDRGYLNPA
ncbi:transposase [Nonomuraea basaltis]|uniref:transposase n=1 Tax=Nonomuraea basaltis TaxID=2495887 RepID=UPI001981758A|nr:transposase [Nonomuraea basaltis]